MGKLKGREARKVEKTRRETRFNDLLEMVDLP